MSWFRGKRAKPPPPPPDGLLQISDRVFVFDSCIASDVPTHDTYQVYFRRICTNLQEHFPDASLLICNFRDGSSGASRTLFSSSFLNFDACVLEYPRHYESCPLLSLDLVDHFLQSTNCWLQQKFNLPGKRQSQEAESKSSTSTGLPASKPPTQSPATAAATSTCRESVLLLHCERGGWPLLAFIIASFLVFHKEWSGEDEQALLMSIYKAAPRGFLQLHYPLNPVPSQARYLHSAGRDVNAWKPRNGRGGQYREWKRGC